MSRASLALLFLAAALQAQVSQHTFPFGKAEYRYSVFTPKPSKEPPSALLLIHGAGGRGIGMLSAWKDLAEKKHIVLVAPDFPLDEKFETTVPELFPALMNTVNQTAHFNPKRVYIFGYSAGGYCTYDAATLSSTYFAAAAVFAAIISPEYDSIVLQAKRKTPIAIYIGTRDQFYTLAQTRRTRDLLQAHHFPVHYVELPDQDHNYAAASDTINADAWKFMSGYMVVPPAK